MQPSTKQMYFVHERHTHVETIFIAFERTRDICKPAKSKAGRPLVLRITFREPRQISGRNVHKELPLAWPVGN